ncbi:MAG: hypothetical protein DWQ36_20925 [Acidobacteria bacterium]|nr:MAG: hypothetical protein DWQ30_21355 [Acidobacteriota bacterium]REK03328.1 MAG: hypothetical protein DWQ36_20925 [Acidobacteriota bacterium]
MTTLTLDTDPEIERRQIEGYRRMTSIEKMQRVIDLNRTVETMARARIVATYQPSSEREIELRLASLHIDRETMIAAFGWDPAAQGL